MKLEHPGAGIKSKLPFLMRPLEGCSKGMHYLLNAVWPQAHVGKDIGKFLEDIAGNISDLPAFKGRRYIIMHSFQTLMAMTFADTVAVSKFVPDIRRIFVVPEVL
jgi:hypothetical protein